MSVGIVNAKDGVVYSDGGYDDEIEEESPSCCMRCCIYPILACFGWIQRVALSIWECVRTFFCCPSKTEKVEIDDSPTTILPVEEEGKRAQDETRDSVSSLESVAGSFSFPRRVPIYISPAQQRASTGSITIQSSPGALHGTGHRLHTDRYRARRLSPNSSGGRRSSRGRPTSVQAMALQRYMTIAPTIDIIQVSDTHRRWIDQKFDADVPEQIKQYLERYETDEEAARRARIYLRLTYFIELLKNEVEGDAINLSFEKGQVLTALLQEGSFVQYLIPSLDPLAETLATRPD